MSPILEVRDLRKSYGPHQAVDGVSFHIEAGQCFGLLGPNGAGKTTTIEVIEGIKSLSGGEILYKGKPPTRAFKQEAGIQFQSTALMDFIRVQEILELFAGFYPRNFPLERLIELCDLGGFLNQFATKLSGGQRQRLLLALALVNDPEIVFLDEPTTGLDPQSRRRFWELIRSVKAAGKTIVLTTHYMEEAEDLCDYLVIMDHGRIIEQGKPQDLLRAHFPHVWVCLDVADFPTPLSDWPEPAVQAGDEVRIRAHSVESALKHLMERQVPLTSLRVRNPSLEDLFLELTGHSLRE